MINQYVIALGSNHQSEIAFNIALNELKTLGEVNVSLVVIGVDFTGKTDRIYHNAVAMIDLYQPCDYDEFNLILKNIEKQCGRNDDPKQVPMDLDILAFYDKAWQIISKRLPFKDHEKKGLFEVAPFLLAMGQTPQ